MKLGTITVGENLSCFHIHNFLKLYNTCSTAIKITNFYFSLRVGEGGGGGGGALLQVSPQDVFRKDS